MDESIPARERHRALRTRPHHAAEAISEFYRTIANDPEATWPYALDVGHSMIENQLDAAIRLA